jgi:fumarate hydratase class I
VVENPQACGNTQYAKETTMSEYTYTPTLQHSGDDTPYRLVSTDGVRVETFNGKDVLIVEPEALERLAYEAFYEVSFFLRPGHIKQVARILDDPDASENDIFVARCFLENSVIAAYGELPTCQDTGTAIVVGHKGAQVWTDFDEKEAFSKGVYRCFQEFNLRYSQIAPLSMFAEKNTGNNLPAQIDIYSGTGMEYELLFVTKGGGSANKSHLFQKTKSLLTEDHLAEFLKAELFNIGTAACPPYHFAVVIGGTSAEATMKYVKLASTGALDDLPTTGDESGRAFRDLEWEEKVLQMSRDSKIGAQFGGKYFCHDVRVIRMPRHAASCPVGIGVSCSADRNVKAKITRDGVFLEQLEHDPAQYAPANLGKLEDDAPIVDLDRPMGDILADLAPPESRRCSTAAKKCPRISKTTPSTTPAPPKPPSANPLDRSAPPPPSGWIPTSTASCSKVAPRSCSPKATVAKTSPTPAPSTAASTSAPSAAPPHCSPRKTSSPSKSSTSKNSAWRPSARSKSSTSPPSSSSMTKATISSLTF